MRAGKPGIYIVWSPDGPTEPRKVHTTHREAAGVAWMMAKKHPGQIFYIMKKTGTPASAIEARQGGDANAAPSLDESAVAAGETP